MDVAAWLERIGLGHYAALFAEQAIDGDVLRDLDDADLASLGLPLGHRKRLLRAIAALQGPGDTGSPAQAPAEPEGARREVTVLYADIAGYTRLSSAVDSEDVHALLQRFFETVDGIVERHGGFVDKHIGDCVMAVFGAPVSHGNDAQRAAGAALTIRDAVAELPVPGAEGRQLAVHIGLAAGEVVAGGTGSSRHAAYTITGETVNLAARLTDAAPAGQVLISDRLRSLLGERCRAEDAGSVEVKGLDRPIRAWRLHAVTDAGGRSTRFVGRSSELGHLAGALARCRASGRGEVLCLRGEAGIGKTRLVEALAAHARDEGFAVYEALVLDFGAERDPSRTLARSIAAALPQEALAPDTEDAMFVNDLLGRPQPAELQAVMEAMDNAGRAQGRRRALARMAVRLSRQAPLLLVVEDVHWADRTTMRNLAALAARTGEAPMLLLLTTRIEGDPVDATWRGWIDAAALSVLDVGPLGQVEARALVEAMPGADAALVDDCVARAAGNPLFLEQLMHHMAAGGEGAVPGSIRSLLQARLDRLSAEDRGALQAASVIGQRFAGDVVGHMRGRAFDPQSLLAQGLIRVRDDGFIFGHALVRDAVYDSMLKGQRRRLHLAAAGWFAARDPVLHAEHLDRAEDPGAAHAYLAAAGLRLGEFRFAQANRLLARGAEIAEDPALRLDILLMRGDVLRELGETQASIDLFAAAAEEAGDASRRRCALTGLAAGQRMADLTEEALATVDRAAALAEEARPGEVCRMLHLRANLCFPLGRLDECRRDHEQALALARRNGLPEDEARALGGLGDAAYAVGRIRTAFEHFDAGIALARAHGLVTIEVANLPMRAATGYGLLRPAEALRDALATIELAERIGAFRPAINAQDFLCYFWFDVQGLPGLPARAEIERMAAAMERTAVRTGALRFRPFANHCRALFALTDGDRAKAGAEAAVAVETCRETGFAFIGPWMLGLQAYAATDAATRDAAIAEGERFLAAGAAISHNHLWFRRYAIEALIEAEDWPAVEHHAAALEAYAAAEPVPWTDLVIARARALAAARAKEAGAGGLLRAVREQAAATGMSWALPAVDAAMDAARGP